MPLTLSHEEEEIRRGKMKIGMALTRRRQPRKAVGTQILCKRTRTPARARERIFLLIFDLGRVSRVELPRGYDHVYACTIGVYVRGNWLSTLPGATTVRRANQTAGNVGYVS